ncbi:MAG TPA: PilC/PilY family type IV pilus protein [Candidatus Binatia bacterium]
MRKTIGLSFVVFFIVLLLAPSLAHADDSDIFGANIEPNVLLLLDSSGSMDDEIASFPYDPDTTYPGSYTSTVVYQSRRSGYGLYRDTIAEVPSSSARAGLSSVGFWNGRIGRSRVNLFVGNYINYQACSSCNQTEKKIDIAKQVLTNLINNTEGVRFGLMRFVNNGSQGQGGGGVVAPIGTAKSTMITALNGINPSGYTPLGEQVRDAGLYYEGNLGYASPIELSCQPNFVIVVSDGLQNGSLDVRNEARDRFIEDHSPFSGTQNVLVHTVGFAIAADEADAANDVLQQAATNGGGSFYTANNAAQLEAALQDAIRQIVAATFTFASPVVPTTSTTGSAKAYIAAFQSDPSRPFWLGFLKAYQRDSNGLVPVDANGIPLDSALLWDAGQQLSQKSASTRTIYTYLNGARQDFTKVNAAITPTALGVATTTEEDKIIDFVRGIDAFDEDADTNVTEERAWKLGDIFHSTPALVVPPFLPSLDPSYTAFKQANSGRPTVLIVGANDGMVHAFRESDGEELWAFIPPVHLSRLQDLTGNSADHPFFVDSSPIPADVKIGGTWKTIVVFGSRRGANTYYALDITDTSDPQFLWAFTDSRLGETWSEPVIGKVKMDDGSDKYVAFLGGGYDTGQNNNSGKAFFVVDLATGQKIWEYYNNSTSDDRQYMNFSIAAGPTAVDADLNGYVDRVYIGDVGGQLWKFDVSAEAVLVSGLASNWTGKRLFVANPSQANPPAAGEYYPAQAFYSAPSLAFDKFSQLWLYIGTGDRNHPNNVSANRFYGIKETTNMTNGSPLTASDLVDVTATDATAVQGWYFTLGTDEKVLAAADVFNEMVFFSTFTPTSTVACGTGGGTAKLYAVQMNTGFAGLNFATGEALATTDSSVARATTVGTGIPSEPIVTTNESGNNVDPSVITGTTSQQLASNPIPPVALKRIVGWREVYY